MLPGTITTPRNVMGPGCSNTRSHTPRKMKYKGCDQAVTSLEKRTVNVNDTSLTEINIFNRDATLSDILKNTMECGIDSDVPIMALDIDSVANQYFKFRRELPRVKPYYAVKCNPNPVLIKSLYLMGSHFDCASIDEMQLIKNICFPDENVPEHVMNNLIVYANPVKLTSHLLCAKKMGVSLLVADSLCELSKISELYPESRVLLRMACADRSSQCPMSGKFGALCEDIITYLLPRAIGLGLNIEGIAFHVGSGCSNLGSLVRALHDARKIFDAAEANNGIRFRILDIGGGFPGGCHQHPDAMNVNESPSFETMASVIRDNLNILFPPSNDFEIIAEPGRFLASSPATLITKIIGKNSITIDTPQETVKYGISPIDAEEPMVRYYLNDGVYGSFNCVIYDHQKVWPKYLSGEEEEDILLDDETDSSSKGKGARCVLFGPTCDGFDTIMTEVDHLPDMQVNGCIYWENMGAYTTAASTRFNGFDVAHMWYFSRNYDQTRSLFGTGGDISRNITTVRIL